MYLETAEYAVNSEVVCQPEALISSLRIDGVKILASRWIVKPVLRPRKAPFLILPRTMRLTGVSKIANDEDK